MVALEPSDLEMLKDVDERIVRLGKKWGLAPWE